MKTPPFFRANRISICLLLLSCLSLISLGLSAENNKFELFSDPALADFHIELDETAVDSLQKEPRSYVRGTARIRDAVLTDVGIRLRGFGSYRLIDDKPSFMLKFDKFQPGKTYNGQTRFVLNNSAQDMTYLHLFFANSLFREAGIPAPRVTHAVVRLNGRRLGLYVLLETFSQPLLQRHFTDASGNLYEGQLRDIDKELEQDGGAGQGQTDLRQLLAAAQTKDPQRRLRNLRSILDVDQFLSFVAMEMMVGHWDGYTGNRNNYRLYHDPGSRRFVFFPHGMDVVLTKPDASIWPARKSIVARAVLQSPEMRQVYRERFGQLFTNVYRLDRILPQIGAAVAKLCSGATNAAEAKVIGQNAAGLTQRISERAQRITEQLAAPEPKPLEFDAADLALLTEWLGRPDTGGARVFSGEEDGRPVLYIHAPRSQGTASWRTRVLLETGRYRFQGQVKAQGVRPVPGEPGAGAGLRISGEKATNFISGDLDWRQLEQVFEVPEGGTEVELICELRASAGEVWFDQQSLRLLHR